MKRCGSRRVCLPSTFNHKNIHFHNQRELLPRTRSINLEIHQLRITQSHLSPNPNSSPQTSNMAPTRSKKRKSTESTTSIDVQNFPAPPQMVHTKTRSPARTPTNRSPIKKQKMGITLAQKQALIDNLQLESKATNVALFTHLLTTSQQSLNAPGSSEHSIIYKHKD